MSGWFVDKDYCDFCDSDSAEYGTLPTCRDCGERACDNCQRPHSWRDAENHRPSCICIHCESDTPEIEELITDVDFD